MDDYSKLSIIIPVYNTEKYIEECIDSLLKITYPSFEIIVIDDGSTDNSAKLIEKYSKLNSKVRYYYQSNQRQGAARNYGMKKAVGDYIYFMDSDDIIDAKKFSKLMNYLNENDEIEAAYFNGESFLDGSVSDKKLLENYKYERSNIYSGINSGEDLYVKMKKNNEFYVSPCLFIFKKSVAINENIKFPEGIIHEDEYFTLILTLHFQKCVYLASNVFKRRIRSNSTITTINYNFKYKSYSQLLEEFDGFFQKHTFNTDTARTLYLKNMRKFYVKIVEMKDKVDSKLLLKTYNEVKQLAKTYDYFDNFGKLANYNYKLYRIISAVLLRSRRILKV